MIEYYDTLMSKQDYRLQEFKQGKLCDTIIYLYLNCIKYEDFMGTLKNPDKMPLHILYGAGTDYKNMKRVSDSNSIYWINCHFPNITTKRAIEVIGIDKVHLTADTLNICLTHQYVNKSKEWIKGKFLTAFFWRVSGNATWKYVFSEEKKNWICVSKNIVEYK